MFGNRKLVWHYIYLILILFIAFLLLAVFLERRTNNLFIEHNKMLLQESGRTLLNGFDRSYFENEKLARQFADKTTASTSFRLTIILPDGVVIADSNNEPSEMDNHADRPEILQAAREGTGNSVRFSSTEAKHFFYVAFRVDYPDGGSPAGFFRLAVPVEQVFRITGNLSTTFILSAATVFFLFSMLSILSLRRLNRSIQTLREAAEEYSRGNLSFQSYIDGPQELNVLNSTLNTMSSNLEDAINLEFMQRAEQDAILSNMIETVILLDSNLCIRRINHAGLKMLGTDYTAVSGKSIIDVIRNSELHTFSEGLLQGTEAQETSITMHRFKKDGISGTNVDLQVHGSVIPINDKTGRGVLLVLHDITRLKKLERIRKEFVANVSHELKTPITSIKGFVESIKTVPSDQNDKREHFLDIIEKHTERLRLIIDDLLTISRLEQFPEIEIEKNTVSLSSFIKGAVQHCKADAAGKEIDIIVQGDSDMEICVNQRLMEQAIINLLDNAVAYSSPASRITICTAKEAGSGMVRIDVIDSGPGIPLQHQERIFERFYRVDKSRSREHGGTGLGLAIVKHIAAIHGGYVEVESEPGKGSTFSILLPV